MIREYTHSFPFWEHCNYKRPENIPLLSIMYPTRYRSKILKKNIDRLRDTIGEQIPIEICIKVDIDDHETIQAISKIKYSNVRYIISERGEGYGSMGKYWNDLASISNGTYLMLWNDDAWLDTPGNLAQILLNRNKDLPCIIRSEARGEKCYFRIIHWGIWERLRETHGYRGDRHIFEGMVFVDVYFADHVKVSVKGHISPEEYELLQFEDIATYEYSHWEGDRIINSHNEYKSEDVSTLIAEVGWEAGWQPVMEDKSNINRNDPRLMYHPSARRTYDEWSILDLIFFNWYQYTQLTLEQKLSFLKKRPTLKKAYQAEVCDLFELLKKENIL